jgi:multiple sugar transport system substrate-binding protein
MRRILGVKVRTRIVLWGWLIGLAAAMTGCGSSGEPGKAAVAPFQGVGVTVAAIGDTKILPTVSAQRGEWEASRGGTCKVLDVAVEPSPILEAHVLIFPAERLGDLVDVGALAVLPEVVVRPRLKAQEGDEAGDAAAREAESSAGAEPQADPVQFDDVLGAFRDQVSKYGSDRMALPYGGTALVLVFNREAFDREANRTEAKAAGIALEPPATWPQLDALAKFLNGRDWDGDGSNDHGIALALGADAEGVGDATYLARAASLGQHRDHYSLLFDSDTMEPRLTTPPFVEALEGHVALKAYGPPGVEGFDAEAARVAFRDGKVALLIDRAERAARWGGGKAKFIGVAPLPGSAKVYEPARKTWEKVATPNRPVYLPRGGGWLVGVSATARGRQREAAIDLVKYLIGPETSNRVRSEPAFPMLPVRGSQVVQGLADPRSAPGVEARSWSEAVKQSLGAARVVPGLRIPRATDYLADLSKGRVAAAKGEPASSALGDVAKAWARRTSSLGTERQLWHYRRSLNALVTTPKPPDRPAVSKAAE